MRAAGIGLDAGALVALERGDGRVRALLSEAAAAGLDVHVTAGVLAQVWRGGPRQAVLARVVGSPEVQVVALDATTARAVGVLAGSSGHADVVDVHVVLDAAAHGHSIVTGDGDDLRAVSWSVALIEI